MPRIAIEPDGPGEGGVPRVRVVLDGAATATVINGAILERWFELPGGFLLFLTDDVPFEDGLEVHLLGPGAELLDSVAFAGAYVTGQLEGLRQVEHRRFRFRFLGDGMVELEVLARPRPMLPLWGSPLGARRGWRRRGWLAVRQAA